MFITSNHREKIITTILTRQDFTRIPAFVRHTIQWNHPQVAILLEMLEVLWKKKPNTTAVEELVCSLCESLR